MSRHQNIWQNKESARAVYGVEEKIALLPFLKKCPEIIWDTVLDLGASKFSLERYGINPQNLVTVDVIGRTKHRQDGSLYIRADMQKAHKDFSLDRILGERAFRQAFPGMDCPAMDTITAFESLNYVPYREVLQRAVSYLKPKGTLCIMNQPDRTFDDMPFLLHPERPKSNNEQWKYCTEVLNLKPLFLLEMAMNAWVDRKCHIANCHLLKLTFMVFQKP